MKFAALSLMAAGLSSQGVNALGEYCTYAIDRLKQGPADIQEIAKSGRVYEDPTFNGRDQLYWLGYNSWGKVRDYEQQLVFGDYAFQRLGDVYPDATMWGTTNPDWHDVIQGNAGTCYIMASMASIAEFPDLIKNIFVTKEKNDAGVYAFRFYVRGKPTIITVDDYFLFKQGSGWSAGREPYFSALGKNNQFWAMLLEKAWAKLRGNYESANGGFIETGLRAFTGCPVISYLTKDQNADTVYATVKAANALNYIMTAGTIGAGDAYLNECGVAQSHAYSIITTLDLMNADGVTVDHKLYMMRNPWGTSYYNQTWSQTDTSSWTAAYRAQVPYGINPLTSQTSSGIYFVSAADFLKCYDDYQIGHFRDPEGYTDDWYDHDGDDGEEHTYEVTVPARDGDLYFTAESYYYAMVPSSCWGGFAPNLTLTLYKNGAQIATINYLDMFHWPLQVAEADYSAGDAFKLAVKYDWQYGFQSYPAKDYTVKVYSKQNLDVRNSEGQTNMWHMDGQFPSGFTKSHYRTETTRYTPPFTAKSLSDAWIASNNVEQFTHMVFENPVTLIKWW